MSPRLPDSAEPARAEEPEKDEKEEDFRLRASSDLSAHVVERLKEPPDKEEILLRNLSRENIWFDKSAVSGAECAYFTRLAKENRTEEASASPKSGKNNKSKSKDGETGQSMTSYKMKVDETNGDMEGSFQGLETSPHNEDPIWDQRSGVLEAEKEYHEKLAKRQIFDGRPEAEEERWVENLRREFVWFDRLEVLEAERNHYAKLAREEAEVSKVGSKLINVNWISKFT